MAADENLVHLDLDTIAWEVGDPPQRTSLEKAGAEMEAFLGAATGWAIEGCYADLIELVLPESTEIIFLDLPVQDCIANAKARPWEPHKYESPEAQNANLSMLIDWISQYPYRDGEFSRGAHAALFRDYPGKKTIVTSNSR
jgi:hypothetical protein